MRQYTRDLYSTVLPDETGMDTGWMPIGFVGLACDEDRLHAYRRIRNFGQLCGVDVTEIPPDRVRELFPLCDTRDVLAGFHVPDDGRANPTDATLALAQGAKQYGASLYEQVVVEGVTKERNPVGFGPPRVTGVLVRDASGLRRSDSDPSERNADAHAIQCNVVVNCAGMWARQFGEASGVHNVPNQAAEHYYLITEPMPGIVDPRWPVLEDSSRCVYIRPEGQGLMLGLFEWEGAAWCGGERQGVPMDFSFGEIQPDWDRIGPYIEAAMERVPAVADFGVRVLFCGPESFTPDNAPVVGESHELRNYYVAAGMNSVGILTGGGIGNILSRWIHRGGLAPNDVDCTGINMHRFHRHQSNPEYRTSRVQEALGNTYRVHYPDHQPKTCRDTKRSPLHDRLRATNAHFRDVSGWESPAWYAPPGADPTVKRESFDREPWFRYWQAEHLSCRNNVALFDMSFMSKFLVQGLGAGAFLNRLSTANVDKDSGRITYTQWLNEEGYMEADLTISKLDEGQFLVIATDTMHNHVLHHMLRRLPGDVFISDVSGRYAQINLQGPSSRELLQTITSVDMSNFEFRQVQEIDIGIARAICARITYVGELGYELFVPVEQSTQTYDRIVQAGTQFGLQHAGLKALGSLRLVRFCLVPDSYLYSEEAHAFLRRRRRKDIATMGMIWTTRTRS
jgi:4-methylaminobutanoate oxidase (formaldehyde-forming)